MIQQKETERVREIYEATAPDYDKGIAFSEKLLFGDGRSWACSQARGQVLEIAVGTGRNLPFYSDDVEITGIEISPAMLAIARQRAQNLGRQVELVLGDAQALPFPDQRFDTIVCTLSLCSIPDERQAIAEVWRVLCPGGCFIALEHVRSPNPLIRGIERLLDSYTVRVQADHLLREPVEVVQAAGFQIDYLKRQKWGIVERLIARKAS
ncbi:MAG TPA: class I SAM-dependent methyltransferase [Ktedonobacteraceae bacterium]|jgi:ubiquinone/menaquinone biosynthesis C-methylase UbiE|nr:class I SAM-dependent methyltransferase [Ktedonobacteraceae bacterium]